MTTPDLHNLPLAEAIAVATRAQHSKLNKHIIARLPLLLPPRASNPSVYVSGLLHIAPIYLTFESLWKNLLDPPTTPAGSISDGCDPEMPILDSASILTSQEDGIRVHRALACDRMHKMLEHLRLPGLMRSDRLREDVRQLTGWPEHVVEEQFRLATGSASSKQTKLGKFIDHIKHSVEDKPHVLVAYSYIFFMALFAGGRFIRASLESIGEDFWNVTPSHVRPTMLACEQTQNSRSSSKDDRINSEAGHKLHVSNNMPLRLFHFPTALDGEDLKREFKQRLSDSEKLLTAREKHDIVQESISIFDNMMSVVNQLDAICSEYGQDDVDNNDYIRLASLPRNTLMYRLRDSVAVAKDRRNAKHSSKDSTTSEDSTDSAIRLQSSSSTESASQNDSNVPPQNQPTVSRMTRLCPGLPKSVRFEKKLAHPDRPSSYDGSSADLTGTIKRASMSVQSVQFSKWHIVVGAMVIAFATLLAGRMREIGW